MAGAIVRVVLNPQQMSDARPADATIGCRTAHRQAVAHPSQSCARSPGRPLTAVAALTMGMRTPIPERRRHGGSGKN